MLLALLVQRVVMVNIQFHIYEFVNDMSWLYLNCDVMFRERLVYLY